jgi:post-segregation antitoxin (ccd killing protein)
MAVVNVNIPDELLDEMKKLNLDVSRFISNKVKEEIVRISVLRAISNRSGMDENKAIELGKVIKKGRYDRLRSQGLI